MSYGKRSVHQLLSTMLVTSSLAVGAVAVPAIAPSSALLGQAFADVQTGNANSVFTWDASTKQWVGHDNATYEEAMTYTRETSFPGPGTAIFGTLYWSSTKNGQRIITRTVKATITNEQGVAKKYASAGDTITWEISYKAVENGSPIQNFMLPIQFADGTAPSDLTLELLSDEDAPIVYTPTTDANGIPFIHPKNDSGVKSPLECVGDYQASDFDSPFAYGAATSTSTSSSDLDADPCATTTNTDTATFNSNYMGDNVLAANDIGKDTISPEPTEPRAYKNPWWVNGEIANSQQFRLSADNFTITAKFTTKVGDAFETTDMLDNANNKILSAKGTVFTDLILNATNKTTTADAYETLIQGDWSKAKQGDARSTGSELRFVRATGNNSVVANQATSLGVTNKLEAPQTDPFAGEGITIDYQVYAVNTTNQPKRLSKEALEALVKQNSPDVMLITKDNAKTLVNAPYGEWEYLATANNFSLFAATESHQPILDVIDDTNPNVVRVLTMDNFPVLGEYSEQLIRILKAKYLTDAQKQSYIDKLGVAADKTAATAIADSALRVDASMGKNVISEAEDSTVASTDIDRAAAEAALEKILEDSKYATELADLKTRLNGAEGLTAGGIAKILRDAYKQPLVASIKNNSNLEEAQRQSYIDTLLDEKTRVVGTEAFDTEQTNTVDSADVVKNATDMNTPMAETTPSAAATAGVNMTNVKQFDKDAAIAVTKTDAYKDLPTITERVNKINSATTLGEIAEQLKLLKQDLLENSVSDAASSIGDMSNLTPAQRRSYLEKLSTLTDPAAIKTLVAEADRVNSAMDSTPVPSDEKVSEDDITAAKNYINNLGLSDPSLYTTSLEAGTTSVTDLATAVNNARAAAKAAIENNDTLREEQKTAYKEAVDKVSGPDVDPDSITSESIKTALKKDGTVNNPVSDASSVNGSMKSNNYDSNTEDASETDKTAATSAIDKLISQYASSNDTLKSELETRKTNATNATKQGEVAKAVDEAMDEILKAKKQEAADKIMSMENLTPAQKYSYISNLEKITLDPVKDDNGTVTSAPSLEEQLAKVTAQETSADNVNSLMGGDTTVDADATTEDKEAAENYIRNIGFLTDDEVNGFLTTLGNATKQSDVVNLINQVKEAAESALNARGPEGTDPDLKNSLTAEQVTAYKEQITKITGKEFPSELVKAPSELVNDIIKGAANVGVAQKANDASKATDVTATTLDKTAADSAINAKAKTDATDPILQKYGLTPDQVNELTSTYNTTDATQGLVGKTVASADEKILENAKEAARQELANQTKLTPAQRIEYAKRIENATTPEEVDSLINGFTAVGTTMAGGTSSETANADDIAAAKRFIEATGVADSGTYTSKLVENMPVSELVQILEDARKAAKEEIAKMKEGETDGYLTAEQVEAYQDAVDKATGKEDDGTSGEKDTEVVNDVVGNARNMNTGMKEDDPTTATTAGEDRTDADVEGALATLKSYQSYLDDYDTRVGNVNSATNLGQIAKELKEARKIVDQKKLDEAKEAAKNAITNLQYVTPEQKQSYLDQVENATTPDQVNTIVESSTSVDSTMGGNPDANANKDKEQGDVDAATTAITNMPALTDADREEFITTELNGKDTSRKDVGETVLDAKARVVERVKEYLEEKTPHLTDEQRQSYIDQIEKLSNDPASQYDTAVSIYNSVQNINTVMGGGTPAVDEEGNVVDPQGSDQDITAAEDAIDSFTSLTEERRNELKESLEGKTQSEIATIVKNAFTEDKTEAKKFIDELPGLTEEQKEEYKKSVDTPNSGKGVQNVVDNATNMSSKMDNDGETPNDASQKEDKTDEDVNGAINTINNLPGLTTEEKQGFIDQFNNVDKTTADVGKTVLEAIGKSKSGLKDQIENLTNLTTEQKEDYKNRIDESDLSKGTEIVRTATNVDSSMGGNANEESEQPAEDQDREAANTAIDSFNFLTEERREELKKQISEAPDQKTIGEIVKDAFEEDKTNAKTIIDGFEELTEEQKTEYKNKVDEAKGGKEVNVPVIEASKVNAKSSIDNLKNLTESEKTEKKNEIDSADTLTAITTVVTSVATTNKERFDDALEKAKEALEKAKAEYEKIRYTNASEDVKKAFEERVTELTNLIASAEETNAIDNVAASELTTGTTNLVEAQNALDGAAAEDEDNSGNNNGNDNDGDTRSSFNWMPFIIGGGILAVGGIAWTVLNNVIAAGADRDSAAAAGAQGVAGAGDVAGAGAEQAAGANQAAGAEQGANQAAGAEQGANQAPQARVTGVLAHTGAQVGVLGLLSMALIALGGIFAFRRRKNES